ncbi:galactosylceramide sulfotransferase-like [Saccoglossus kowalevskii]|uniref:Galactosylceramide sulfotransferase-like n=1 Tax=Saccoglossus kowalevskii TaxID=10224 RepID=A0ABM0GJ61_SACKO|nr:PREDICTED: galactosylceramide sulfotransferase-like [Saccoglossus kowalevskii]
MRASASDLQAPTCDYPLTNVVFLKTYKTASTTVSSILIRHGLRNNLSFVLPSHHNPGWFSRTERFNSKMAKQLLPPLPGTQYNMLVSHVPFNKQAIDKVIRNATYITILRHPVANYESIFGFMKIANYFHINQNTSQDPFEVFLSNTTMYFKRINDSYHKTLLSNRQIFDVGLDLKNYNNETLVDNVIQQASDEFDFVLIAEYFDESLVLLKKLLCWDFKDIMYFQQNKRNNKLRFDIDDWKRQRILEINKADYKLYQHFNKTFWREVEAYGDNFHEDLATFRDMLLKIQSECVDEDKFVIDYKGRRNATILKNNAPTYCNDISKDGFDNLGNKQKATSSNLTKKRKFTKQQKKKSH